MRFRRRWLGPGRRGMRERVPSAFASGDAGETVISEGGVVMLLLYDHKCTFCRNLAYKIHLSTAKTVDIRALSDPEAARILEKFYPEGWSHDFYIVENGACRKGLRALPKLLKTLGPARFGSALAEYLTFKLSQTSCELRHDGHGVQVSKRNLLKYAAMTPVLYGAAKLPKLEEPFRESPGGILVHIAEVDPRGSRDYAARAYRCDQCLRPTSHYGVAPAGSKTRTLEESVLREATVRSSSLNGSGTASPRVRQSVIESERSVDGQVLRRTMTMHNGLLDDPRYNVSINVGYGPVTTAARTAQAASLAGMIGYDLPVPVADFVVYHGAEGEDVARHLNAYVAGIRELSRLHAEEGRTELARLYGQIESGVGLVASAFDEAVPERRVPIKNKLTISPMPEVLRYVELPSNLDVRVQGCTCSCSCCCGCCCGCGCGCALGFCLPPGICTCCCGCVCGCGC